MEVGPRSGAAAGARGSAWRHWVLVVLANASLQTTAGLLVCWILGGFRLVAFGVMAGQFVASLWRDRPGREGVRPSMSDAAVRRVQTGVVAVDAGLVVATATTSRLPAWTPVLAVVLLVVHAGLLLRLRARIRREAALGARGGPAGPAGPGELRRWLAFPEPLRTAWALAFAGTLAMVSAVVVDSLRRGGVDAGSTGLRAAAVAWGGADALLGAVLALDLGGAATAQAQEARVVRAGPGRPLDGAALGRWRRRVRLVGASFVLLGGFVIWLFAVAP